MAHKYPAGTFLFKLAADLENYGMLPNQAEDVMALFIKGEEGTSMASRWMDDPEGYPEVLYNLCWRILCTYALQYIDEMHNVPWYRPCFLGPEAQEAWLKENGSRK